jgi:protein-serine/threonine kinase
MAMRMDLYADPLTPPEDSRPPHSHVLRFANDNASLPKNKSTSNLLSQMAPPPLSLQTKRMSIDAGQLDRMAR